MKSKLSKNPVMPSHGEMSVRFALIYNSRLPLVRRSVVVIVRHWVPFDHWIE
jgi:hypothetical protein